MVSVSPLSLATLCGEKKSYQVFGVKPKKAIERIYKYHCYNLKRLTFKVQIKFHISVIFVYTCEGMSKKIRIFNIQKLIVLNLKQIGFKN